MIAARRAGRVPGAGRVPSRVGPGPCGGGAGGDIEWLACEDSTRRRGARVRGEEEETAGGG